MPKQAEISLLEILHSKGSLLLKTLKVIDYILGYILASILPKSKPSSPNLQPQRMLIIRPGGIGDAVFLLPILEVLRNKGIAIDILCEPRNAEVFSSQGYSVYMYTRWSCLKRVLYYSYDVVIDTEQWHYLSAIISYCAKAECRIGFATRALRAKLFNKQVVYGEHEYELSNFLRLFEGLMPSDVLIESINHTFRVPDKEKKWAATQIPDQSAVVFLGASIPLRRLSTAQIVIIVNELLANNLTPVLIGGRDVLLSSQEIINEYGGQRVLNFVGKTNLIETAALIERCQRFIGPDSGLMHLACAVGTPVLAFFGPGNLNKWRPKGSEHRVITNNAVCSPCTQFGYTIPTCKGSFHCVDFKQMKENF